MNIGIYGGTFNPPHVGHSRVMHAVISQLNLERLILIPTGEPPHKEMPEGASLEDRFAMTQLVGETVEESCRRRKRHTCVVETNDMEMRRSGKSFTIDSLESLRVLYPEDDFYLIMGEDMFLTFLDWVTPDKIVKRAKICTFLRNDQKPSEALIGMAERVQREYGAEVKLIRVPYNQEVSSTEIRENLSLNMLNPTLVPQLMPCTLGQIIDRRLYGVDVSLQNMDHSLLRALVWGYVKPKRVAHIVGVEQECARLARRWGVDEYLARRAGILHDITKYWTLEEHLAFCEKYSVILDHLEWSTEKLLHAKSGAGFAKHILGESDEVCEAIDCHTTGKANMSALSKILYLADYIEPQRDFEELAKLRALSYENLDGAVGYGLSIALAEMEARNKITHQNTLQAYEQYGKA